MIKKLFFSIVGLVVTGFACERISRNPLGSTRSYYHGNGRQPGHPGAWHGLRR